LIGKQCPITAQSKANYCYRIAAIELRNLPFQPEKPIPKVMSQHTGEIIQSGEVALEIQPSRMADDRTKEFSTSNHDRLGKDSNGGMDLGYGN
jgi:hypothetical protein